MTPASAKEIIPRFKIERFIGQGDRCRSAPPPPCAFSMSMANRIFLIVSLLTGGLLADEPVPPPRNWIACSATSNICADLDSDNNLVTVFEQLGSKERRTLWSMPGWYRVAFVSNDGEYLAVGIGSLLPRYDSALPIIRFFRRGHLTESIRLAAVASRDQTKRTESNVFWGNYEGFGSDGRFWVKTADGRRLSFAPKP